MQTKNVTWMRFLNCPFVQRYFDVKIHTFLSHDKKLYQSTRIMHT